jgi:hypothetical protein
MLSRWCSGRLPGTTLLANSKQKKRVDWIEQAEGEDARKQQREKGMRELIYASQLRRQDQQFTKCFTNSTLLLPWLCLFMLLARMPALIACTLSSSQTFNLNMRACSPKLSICYGPIAITWPG